MSICKSALFTMKTASGIKRDDKQICSWVNVIIQIMKSSASCQPDEGMELGSYATNHFDQTALFDDVLSEATPSPSNNSSDGPKSLDSCTQKPNQEKMYVPIK